MIKKFNFNRQFLLIRKVNSLNLSENDEGSSLNPILQDSESQKNTLLV